MVGTGAVNQFCLGLVLLTADTVEGGVDALIYVAGIVESLENKLYGRFVGWIGGPDEAIVADVQLLPGRFKLGGDAVCKIFRCLALADSGFLDLGSMLIGTGQKEAVVTDQPIVSGEYVSCDCRVGCADVWGLIDIVYRCRDVELLHTPPVGC